jgi:hypothetical protein
MRPEREIDHITVGKYIAFRHKKINFTVLSLLVTNSITQRTLCLGHGYSAA